MKPAAFDYIPVESIEAALAALDQAAGDAKIIAGGQSLVPMLNFRLLKPSVLVDINRIPDLAFVIEDGEHIRIGALTRHRQLETSPLIANRMPVITEAMRHVAHLAIRNRGTIGGSLSHGDPAAELPMLACLLDAELTIVSSTGKRLVSANHFFQGQLTVDLGENEMLTEIRIAKTPPMTGWSFAEVARRGGDFALAAVAVTLTVAHGVVGEARIALMGVGDRPQRARDAEALIAGHTMNAALLNVVAELVRGAVEPETDLHASADYRRHLVGALIRRTLAEAWDRARSAAA
jgi:CO/xanthine dehydrogenase FAD-binding subunit